MYRVEVCCCRIIELEQLLGGTVVRVVLNNRAFELKC
jgi:hypothetical protein